MRVVTYVMLSASLMAQIQRPLTFEVASVKPSAPNQRGGIIRQMPGNQRYVATNIPLRPIMTVAYSVTDRQISGGPSWTATDPFDIDARASKPGTADDLHVMLQHLIEERFRLKVRDETKELPVYELVLDNSKGALKLPEHDAADINHFPFQGNPTGMEGSNVTMEYFAFVLSRNLDRNVIDKTGLPAHYDVKLQFAPEPGPNGGRGAVDSDLPSIFTALKQQLGLKLVPAKGPVKFLVIEHAEKPEDN